MALSGYQMTLANVCFGGKADIALTSRYVRL